jgi:hypothetical protein
MSRLLAWLAGAVGLAVLLRRRRKPPAQPEFDPAGELRRKLDESRAVVDEREEFEAGETPIDQAESLEDRRRRVHDAGRAALEDMHGPSAD